MGTGGRVLLGMIAGAAIAGAAAAQALPEDVAARVDTIVRTAMERDRLKAVLAGVSVDGRQEVWAWGQSMTGVPATPDMHFRNGAVAIAYLGTLLLQLHDKGALDLDAALSDWFPDYPAADEITLTMLINGTSGYADYVTDEGFIAGLYGDPFRAWTEDELTGIAFARGPVCAPGACWSYAHTNFVVLGQVLAKVGGKPLDVLLRENILDPLDLANTRSALTAAIPEPVLHAFDAERGRYEESTFWDPSWTLAHGAIMTSTVSDILTSAVAFGEGTLLAPESHALQLAPLTAKLAPWNDETYYGLGVFMTNGWVVQNPSFAGYAATMAYLPARKLGIVTSTTMYPDAPPEANLSTTLLKEIAAALAPDAPL